MVTVSHRVITLGANAQDGYSACFVCLCLSVCLSVTTLAASSFISMIKQQYERLQFSIIFSTRGFPKNFHSQVMTSLILLAVANLGGIAATTVSVFYDGGSFCYMKANGTLDAA